MFFLGLIGLPFTLLSKKWAYKIIKLYCWICFFILRIMVNIRVECRGDIPKGNVLICSKHMSFLDVLMLAYFLPRVNFVMKKELVFTPIIGIYGLRIGCVPVARGTKSKALNNMIRGYENSIYNKDEQQIVIYPQGTRVLPDEKKQYKIGAGVLYDKLDLPCHLVATNSGIFWPKGSWRRNSGLAVIKFINVLEPGLTLNKFMKETEKNIERESKILMDEGQIINR